MFNQYGTGSNSEANTTLGVDGIREFKIITNMFSAEYGLRMGSQMVMVSKSGSNSWHGDAFEYLRNDHLDARNFFDSPASSGLALSETTTATTSFAKKWFWRFGRRLQWRKTRRFFYLGHAGSSKERQGTSIVDTTLPTACHQMVPGGVGEGGTGTGAAGYVLDTALQNAPFPSGANLANPT